MMSAEQTLTAELVSRLINYTLAKSGCSATNKSQYHDRLYSYSVRLLGSNIFPDVVGDDHAALQLVRHDLDQKGRHDFSVRVAELHQQLAKSDFTSRKLRWAVLQLLHKLTADGGAAQSSGLLQPLLALAPRMQLLPLQASDERVVWQAGAHNPLGGGAPYTVSLPPSMRSSMEPAAGAQQGGMGQRESREVPGGFPSTPQRAVSPGPPAGGSLRGTWGEGSVPWANESALVHCVLLAIQGVSSQHLVMDDLGGGFRLRDPAALAPYERSMMMQQAELGWLFMKVRQHITSVSEREGGVRQALCAAFQAELRDFYRLLAVLEAHSHHAIPTPGCSDEEAALPYLTLRRLSVWLAEPTARLRLLAMLADGTAGLRGGALAGAVYLHSQHGDPLVSSFMGRCLQRVCVPLFEMIRRWAFQGLHHDPAQEFFIIKNPELDTDPALDLWRDGYWIDASRLPPFLGRPLAERILRAGKSLHFLQRACGDAKWVLDFAAAAQSAADAPVGSDQISALEAAVAEACSAVDRRLMEVLRSKFAVPKHCDAIRRYLLLAQGDFVQALMDLVGRELDQDATQVSEVNLNHLVRAAVAGSCAKYDDDDVMERLAARRQRPVGQEKGWDVFSLHYEVNGPLATLLTPACMTQYLRSFQLLWKLKRAEHALASAWQLLKADVERSLPRMRALAGAVPGSLEIESAERKALQLRSEMSHFCTNLQYYIMFEVLEGAWQEFSKQLVGARDLDELIKAHETYQEAISSKALLDETAEALRKALDELLTNMLGLAALVSRLAQEVQRAEAQLHERRRAVGSRTAVGTWGTSAQEDDTTVVTREEILSILQGLEEKEKAYSGAHEAFTRLLPMQAHEEVRFLLARLDFSEFYKSRRATATEDGRNDDDQDN